MHIHTKNYSQFGMYNVNCMYIWRTDFLVLDNLFFFCSLMKNVSLSLNYLVVFCAMCRVEGSCTFPSTNYHFSCSAHVLADYVDKTWV